jgi:hypothetical protein
VQLKTAIEPIGKAEFPEDPELRRADEITPRLSFAISFVSTAVAVIGNTPSGFSGK